MLRVGRRAFPHVLNMIQAVALLHQRQREQDPDGRLIATAEDYQIARHLLLKPMARLLGNGLSEPARRFFDRLQAWASGTFTSAEAKKRERNSKSSVHGWLNELHEAGLLGSSHLHLPPVMRWFTANIGAHHVHHVGSRIPFYRLPQVLNDHPQLKAMSRITLGDSFRAMRLSLWDEAAGRLVSFAEARRRRNPSLAGA